MSESLRKLIHIVERFSSGASYHLKQSPISGSKVDQQIQPRIKTVDEFIAPDRITISGLTVDVSDIIEFIETGQPDIAFDAIRMGFASLTPEQRELVRDDVEWRSLAVKAMIKVADKYDGEFISKSGRGGINGPDSDSISNICYRIRMRIKQLIR